MGSPRYRTVIFDLDGTILRTEEGVLHAIRYALAKLGRAFPANVDQRRFIGPPLRYSFHELCGLPEDEVVRAVMLHREYYGEKGAYEAEPYPGIIELMRDLAQDGVNVCIATSKYRAMADKVIDHFGIRPYLTYAAMSGGSEASSAKREIIGDVLAHLGVSASDAVMIGDTAYDAEGAREWNMPFIGVVYGYGTREEMAGQGASVFAADAAELRRDLYM